jgi:hypothetical protein
MRAHAVRSILTVLAPAPVLFLVVFLFFSPLSRLTIEGEASASHANVASKTPIVMIVFDAFSTEMLMDERRQIDAARYPNFARLARDSTWYRNATTAHENTVKSVPSTIDGNIPEKGKFPIAADHPNSLFTLLGSNYRMELSEEATNLCPAGLCTDTNQEPFLDRMRLLAGDVSAVYEYLLLP